MLFVNKEDNLQKQYQIEDKEEEINAIKDSKDIEITQLQQQIDELNDLRNTTTPKPEHDESFLKIDNWVQTEPVNYLNKDLNLSQDSRERYAIKTPFSSNDDQYRRMQGHRTSPDNYQSLQRMLKIKEQQNRQLRDKNESLKKELQQMKNIVSVKTNMDTINDLIVKLDASEKQVIELKQEIMTQKRLLNLQGKSLNKIVNENDYPTKIKQLLDEIRY